MKKDILIFATLVFVAILILIFTAGLSVIDIQFHDTYIVLDQIWVTVLIIGPLTFLIFLSLGLARKFKIVSTNIGFIIGLSLISLVIFKAAQFQSSYRDQIQTNLALQLPSSDKERFVTDMDKRIILTWGLFGICIVGIGLTGYRTYQLMSTES